MLVDDDLSVRQTISLLLNVDHHIVITAPDAVEALDLLQRDRFDLVITDFDMPGILGDELARRIKRQSPWQPILMMTACPEKRPDLDNGVDAVLGKPFPLADLRGAIAAVLNDSRRPGCAVHQSVSNNQDARFPDKGA